MLALIRRCLHAGVTEAGQFRDAIVSVPQGGVISALLANIHLHALEKVIAKPEAGESHARFDRGSAVPGVLRVALRH